MDYKDTLNLPKTDFPMKAGLGQLEPKLLGRWREMDVYKRVLESRQGRPMWVLHDGPPYANGHIHAGTALNKILKDIIVKSKTMEGFLSPYVPGWDCHGLPIEHQVDKSLGSKKRELSRSDIRRLCRQYAEKFVAIQSEEFQRLGVLGDWGRPYLTMRYSYEAVIAKELGRMALDGRLARSLKPVLWCGSCRTALAEAEVEYEEAQSDSIFVAFPLKEGAGLLNGDLSGREVSLAIWTTTPWTIPSNLAIAYNPSFAYGAYELGDRVLVVAKSLAGSLWPRFHLGLPSREWEVDASAMKGLKAAHPLYGRDSLIVGAQYVTLEQGTGLVHTAPGHGREDFETGLAHNLPILSPIDDDGRFTGDVPELKGLKVLEANPKVIEALEAAGALLAKETISHQYPHCWRCKNPVSFRSTPQWFVTLDEGGENPLGEGGPPKAFPETLRAETLKAIDKVAWVPRWGRERIHGMIESRPDWCVSRQRSWGVPITIFFCQNCGQWHYSEGVRDKLFQIFSEKGADAWYDLSEKELMPEGEKCPGCGGGEFRKETDILDVWFDSGCSFAAVCEERGDLPDKPDMYLEGSDQHRGWFHSSLLVSVANRGRAPYSEVLTHGYVVDGTGRKMSKSLGNTIDPDFVIKKYGADILRLWVSSENYHDDIRLSPAIMDMLSKAYFNFRNTARFILGNLFDFEPGIDAAPLSSLGALDRYVLHQLAKIIGQIRAAYKAYEFHVVYQLINKFVVLLSSLYHDVVKDRLYTWSPSHPGRRAVQTVMWRVLSSLTRLMAPILSFTAEEIWLRLSPGDASTIFTQEFPEAPDEWRDEALAAEMDSLLGLRAKANKALEEARRLKLIGGSLEARVTLSASGAELNLLKKHEPTLAELLIVSEVALMEGEPGSELVAAVAPSTYPKCPRCWIRHPEASEEFGRVCPKCREALGQGGAP
ncbi:MAG: isoleucine--tRNA ligase [Deltaproteobacteria bacterium]|jgi:isoleucyl-tRNA synthetase|nr:isoleucine--tRNA ligase [Deltaproteobacteria bacterium]